MTNLAVNASRNEILVLAVSFDDGEVHTREIQIKDYTWDEVAQYIIDEENIVEAWRVCLSNKPEDADANENILDEAGRRWADGKSSDELRDAPTCWRDLPEVIDSIVLDRDEVEATWADYIYNDQKHEL